MQSKNNMKRKGFTLVELLIVIVVIGILSAMMMLSSTEAVSSAKASNIVSNLRNLKTAALAYYVDHLDDLEDTAKVTETDAPTVAKIKTYMNNSDAGDYDSYTLVFSSTTGAFAQRAWYIVCNTGTGSDSTRVQQKLEGRAKSVGLLLSASGAAPASDSTTYTATNGQYVAMKVR